MMPFTGLLVTPQAVCAAADVLRQRECGDAVSYTVNRNINYTNICYYKCQFCAFSKVRSPFCKSTSSRKGLVPAVQRPVAAPDLPHCAALRQRECECLTLCFRRAARGRM